MHEFHPFSVTNSPNADGGLRFAIRADGDFSRRALDVAEEDTASLSMLVGQGRKVTFLYSVRPGTTALYLDELAGLAERGMDYQFIMGQYSDNALREATASQSIVLIGGPAPMLKHITRLLRQDGIPAADITSKPFMR